MFFSAQCSGFYWNITWNIYVYLDWTNWSLFNSDAR